MDVQSLAGWFTVELAPVDGVPPGSADVPVRNGCGRDARAPIAVAEVEHDAAERLVARREAVLQVEVVAEDYSKRLSMVTTYCTMPLWAVAACSGGIIHLIYSTALSVRHPIRHSGRSGGCANESRSRFTRIITN